MSTLDTHAGHVVAENRRQAARRRPVTAAADDRAQAGHDRRAPFEPVTAVDLQDPVRRELRGELFQPAPVAGVVVTGEGVAHRLPDREFLCADHAADGNRQPRPRPVGGHGKV
jgi:hypothetical protein